MNLPRANQWSISVRKMLADLLYNDRLLVDYTDKELSIWPREDWPFFQLIATEAKYMVQAFQAFQSWKNKLLLTSVRMVR